MMADDLIAWTLVSVLIGAGFLNVVPPAFVRSEFAAWGYPSWLRVAVGLTEWLAAMALMFRATRLPGCGLTILVLIGVIATLSKNRQWMRLEYPAVLLVLSSWIAARTVGLL